MYYVIKRPLVTEKNSMMAEKGVYVFEVERDADKRAMQACASKGDICSACAKAA